MARTDLIFLDPEMKPMAYTTVVVFLTQKLPPIVSEIFGEFIIFQQDDMRLLTETMRDINLLEGQTPAFISSDLCPNSSNLNPVDYGEKCSSGYETKVDEVNNVE